VAIKKHTHRPTGWFPRGSVHMRWCRDGGCDWEEKKPHRWGNWSKSALWQVRFCKDCNEPDRRARWQPINLFRS